MTDATLPGLGDEFEVPDRLVDRLQKCRSCGAPIVWAMTRRNGNPGTMPVDPVPSPRGNLRVTLDGGTLRAIVDAVPSPDDPDRFLSHFATCRDAKKWRRK